MKPFTLNQKTLFPFLIFIILLTFTSCDKAENLMLTDSEKLMKDLKGTWNLVSVQEEVLHSLDGGNNFTLASDSTYIAAGTLDLASVDKADYTGTLVINYNGINETHSINGNAIKSNSLESIWIITDSQENILAMTIYSFEASYLQGWLDERDDNHILLRVSEAGSDNSAHINRKFKFEKAK